MHRSKGRVRVALAVLTLGLGMSALPGAHAIEYDPAACAAGATGTADFTPAVQLTPADTTVDLAVSCTTTGPNYNGPNHNVGAYSLAVHADIDDDTCAAGATTPATGTGTVTGTGPEGPVSGSIAVRRTATGLTVAGAVQTGGYDHILWMGFQLQNTTYNSSASACPFDHADLVGSISVMDIAVPPPPPSGAIAVQGSGTISPGLWTTPTFESWTQFGTWTGEFNGEPGTCNYALNGSSTSAETIFNGTWAGSGGCVGTTTLSTPINIHCTVTFTRVTLSFVVNGTCTGTTPGTLSGELSMSPTSPFGAPTTSYTVAGYVAIA